MAITKVHTNIANHNTSVAGFPASNGAANRGFGAEVLGTNTGFGVVGTDGTDYFEVLDALPQWYLREADNVDQVAGLVRLNSDAITGSDLHLNLTGPTTDDGHIWKDVRLNRGTTGVGGVLEISALNNLVTAADSDSITLDVGDEITQTAVGGAFISGQIIAVRQSTTNNDIHLDIQLLTGPALRNNFAVGIADGVLLNNASDAETATFGQNIDTSGLVDVAVPVADRKIKPAIPNP